MNLKSDEKLRKFLLVSLLLFFAMFLSAKERKPGLQPDHLDFGTVYQGSIIDASFMIKNCEKILSVKAPPWIIIGKKSEGIELSFARICEVQLQVNTFQPGSFKGSIDISTEKGKVSLPVSVVIRNYPEPCCKVAVFVTPFSSQSTQNGSDFNAMTQLMMENFVDINYLENFPKDLARFDTLILAEDAYWKLSRRKIKAIEKFLKKGGKLIVFADYFFGDSVRKANSIVYRYGLHLLLTEYPGEVIVEEHSIVPCSFTKGVKRLRFFRPSPVIATSPKAKILVRVPNNKARGFVAVSKAEGKGLVVVIGESLWWSNLSDGISYDNGKLLINILKNKDY